MCMYYIPNTIGIGIAVYRYIYKNGYGSRNTKVKVYLSYLGIMTLYYQKLLFRLCAIKNTNFLSINK